MGGVGTDQPLLARRWGRLEVAADVPGGQAHRPHAADGQVGEVLADPAPVRQHLVERGGDGREARVVDEVGVDPLGQGGDGVDQRGTLDEGRLGVVADHLGRRHERRLEAEFAGVQHLGAEVVGEQVECLAPARSDSVRWVTVDHVDQAGGRHRHLEEWPVDHERRHRIAGAGAPRCGSG